LSSCGDAVISGEDGIKVGEGGEVGKGDKVGEIVEHVVVIIIIMS
jgi:hypothetical protein